MILKDKLKKLREARYMVLACKDEEFTTCSWMQGNEECWSQASWYIDGDAYCEEHAERIADVLLGLGR